MPKERTFEDAVSELEKTVDLLENGDVSLDEAVKLFEEGMKISKECHERLEKAEQKVKLLTEDKDGVCEKNFDIGGEG